MLLAKRQTMDLCNFDSPRYSTGYTSLFNTIGFVVEHMLKKYADKSNIRIHASTINFMDANYQKIKQMRVQNENSMHLKIYPIKWEIDTAKVSNFHFWF
jgi:pimeloyl-CoA synthetase